MKILVINGSPKGKNSLTFQTMLFLKQCFPMHQYSVIHAGAQIKKYEYDFSVALRRIKQADLIIFSYPVYTFLAPTQLHRFIELMKEAVNDGKLNLEGKVCTQLTTSKHFYDITAHRYIEDNCAEMGMRVIRGLSADMEDLTTKKGRKEAKDFFEHLQWRLQKEAPTKTMMGFLHDVVVVADVTPEDSRLQGMIDRFVAASDGKAKVVNLHEFPFRGGCISCFRCSTSGECIYTDGFQELLRGEIQQSSAVVYAFRIKDHSMGSVFKTFDDRQFCNGHRTVTMGRPTGYIIDGDLTGEENLRTVIEARAQVGGNYLAGIATEGEKSQNDLFMNVEEMAAELAWCIVHRYTQPANFYGVGGMKIFRDLIWQMQGFMKADYKFFKEHGQMDFPYKHPEKVLMMYAVGAMMGHPELKNKMGDKMNEGMLMPYKEAFRKGKKE